jgi:DNA-binding HxlR family transcriptional regulator
MAALRSASSTSDFPYSSNFCSVIKNKCSVNEIKMSSAAAILFGKTRQAVLTHLFDQPERTAYLRELSRQTGIGPGPLQNELNQLRKADLVIRQQAGNRVRYAANVAHPIFGRTSVHRSQDLQASCTDQGRTGAVGRTDQLCLYLRLHRQRRFIGVFLLRCGIA